VRFVAKKDENHQQQRKPCNTEKQSVEYAHCIIFGIVNGLFNT
jgi:hypothetical protein